MPGMVPACCARRRAPRIGIIHASTGIPLCLARFCGSLLRSATLISVCGCFAAAQTESLALERPLMSYRSLVCLKWAETHGWYIMVFLTLVLGLGTPVIYTVIGAIPGVQFNLIVLAAITLNGSYIGISTSHCLIKCLDVDLNLTTGDSRSSIGNQRSFLYPLNDHSGATATSYQYAGAAVAAAVEDR
ncbi:Hypothetical Protein FCC1311_029422 [Hondaea fermentalgiana]|uniref:Uncharacterized protein n=1 Tax=Hondaea fermentalgiana TaxID=2315210 RepID=A0A2R5GEQ7_9STRA|nr:Hypothetical Protein FCC1311_029422 [Hondaea fermentalgiana]|eukprot:GBG26721.1 Hypothetical Protein FCC1311_029422 [Hondaea fermentalgiana]